LHAPSRRQFLVGSAAAAATLTCPAPFVHAQKAGGTLRFVPHADLRVLDVTRYTGYITNRTNAYLVYDTLFSQDEKGQIRPQMVDTWTVSPDRRKWNFTLRDGLKFHDGQAVTAEDCVVSLRRWSQRDPLGQFFIAATERLQATDKKSFALELGKPFGLVLEALAKPSAVVPFILPARIAATPEEDMIKEAIGSGPYKVVGNQGWVRPNHLQPPFNNKKARQALTYMVDQERYLQAAVGQAKYYRQSGAYFVSKSEYGSGAGAPSKPDFERARRLMKEAGYDGKPIVVLDPTNIAMLHAVSLVTGELLQKIGCKVDVQAMDWGTLVARRAMKTPASEGGWNILHTWWSAADMASPALNAGVAGVCDKAFFGWYCSEPMEKMRRDFVAQADPVKRKQLAEEIQKFAYDDVPYALWGEFVTPAAVRKNVRGMLTFPAPLLWNLSIES